jgi:hypothetical protein
VRAVTRIIIIERCGVFVSDFHFALLLEIADKL